jgi:glutamine amidotransferase
MPSVCILNYGSGNVRSVSNLFSTECSATTVSNSEEAIAEATHIVLPGVGAFGAAMRKIGATIPMEALNDALFVRRVPFLGICVGMQVMADRGFEFGEHPGLGWISGSVNRLEAGELPLPHIGWNNIRVKQTGPLLAGLESGADFYFLHSFVVTSAAPELVSATAEYGEEFCCALQRDNLFGVQFHPEKSQGAGRRLVRNFLSLT